MARRETLSTRVARLEQAHTELTQKHGELDDKVKILLDAQIKTEERFQFMGERIEKLVIAIGELVNRMPPAAPTGAR